MPKPPDVVVESNVPILMRDGILLYADVYRPLPTGRHPVLVQRTPYEKSQFAVTGIDYLRAARAGYAVVVQDVRGRFSSPGEFYPFLHEIADGYDTVEWAAVQPWSNGRVGMVGGSYLGATQWLAAIARPLHLRALFPAVTPSDYQEGWAFRGGAFQLGFCLSWVLGPLVLANFQHLAASNPSLAGSREMLIQAADQMGEAFRRLPLRQLPYFANGAAPYYDDWLEHADDEAYWDRWRIETHHSELAIPAYHVGGWYDTFLAGTLHSFAGLQAAQAAPQRLIIGPWTHATPLTSLAGELDFGLASAASSIDLDGIQLRWFDHWLRDKPSGLLEEPPVRLFVMGENRWRDEQEWPPARVRETRYYLHSQGNANSARGDGWLDTHSPTAEPADTFEYDPHDPVPTRGGGLCCDPFFLPGGAFDQRQVENRRDVLVYTSAVLERDMEVTGPVQLRLWAASSAPDTDFTAKLVDVYPSGAAYNLADGIIRARYRQSRSYPSLLQPGSVYEFVVDIGATSNLFKAGHRIRLEVSSSNFPRFDRNPNTGTPLGASSETRSATQTVLHNEARPSFLILPVAPRK